MMINIDWLETSHSWRAVSADVKGSFLKDLEDFVKMYGDGVADNQASLTSVWMVWFSGYVQGQTYAVNHLKIEG